MRSKHLPNTVEVTEYGGHIVRGLFYDTCFVVEVDGKTLNTFPWMDHPDLDLYDLFLDAAKQAVNDGNSSKSVIAEFRKKDATFFVATDNDSGKWSIIVGVKSSGKFVDSMLRFETKEEAEEALK